jgi:hypothetical protein
MYPSIHPSHILFQSSFTPTQLLKNAKRTLRKCSTHKKRKERVGKKKNAKVAKVKAALSVSFIQLVYVCRRGE